MNLIVIGEAREWETVEYVRDASQAGMPKAVIILGHVIFGRGRDGVLCFLDAILH